jgi:hypothetical protein
MEKHKWIKINPDHRPAAGHAILATLNPEEGGTLYYVRDVNKNGFTVESDSTNGVNIPDDQRVSQFIPYEDIPKTNFYVWDRHRENNYEIDDIYSN